jgi:hypothetical protein
MARIRAISSGVLRGYNAKKIIDTQAMINGVQQNI